MLLIVPVSEWWDASSGNCSLLCWPLSLLFQYFSNPWFTGLYLLLADIVPSNDVEIATMTVSTLHTHKYWKVGGAINHCLISVHFSIRACFLTTQTYKRMRLSTRVYSNLVTGNWGHDYKSGCITPYHYTKITFVHVCVWGGSRNKPSKQENLIPSWVGCYSQDRHADVLLLRVST